MRKFCYFQNTFSFVFTSSQTDHIDKKHPKKFMIHEHDHDDMNMICNNRRGFRVKIRFRIMITDIRKYSKSLILDMSIKRFFRVIFFLHISCDPCALATDIDRGSKPITRHSTVRVYLPKPYPSQPVVHNWFIKGRGMYCSVYGKVHIKDPLLLIEKSSLCGGSGFPSERRSVSM